MRKIRWVCLALAVAVIPLFPAGCAGSDIPGGMTREKAGLGYADGVFTAQVRGQICRTEDGEPSEAEEATAAADSGQTAVAQSLIGQSLTGQPWSVAALVTVGAPGEDGSRVVSVQYQEPDSLAGLTVTGRLAVSPESGGRTAGYTQVTVTEPFAGGDLSVESADGRYDRLLALADALLAAGDIRAVGQSSSGGRTVTVADPALPYREMVYTFEKDSVTPTHVRMSDGWGWLALDVEVSWGG
jgi:hypothetical protein